MPSLAKVSPAAAYLYAGIPQTEFESWRAKVRKGSRELARTIVERDRSKGPHAEIAPAREAGLLGFAAAKALDGAGGSLRWRPRLSPRKSQNDIGQL
ncbi:hypothetical protein G6L94_32465 [Agrobacterium rhizogenes]|uniref:hypothetical protein n=1 Tax=Rhizobium rhizogenes TaxID=359 RepID=UPI00080FD6F0|nr:hypothetical protein [Rhizobium rhizogenes]OCJ22475.1 hypothetical protein A6U88_29180 [Agrobacterium sp. B131/95]OCJ28535.1 hypothetical protein A6U89_28395 [Agrobacterium sp. B133/95]NTI46348.1 hypothetical protein [Rhizobium rhizogenes]NTI53032.1 hypothetical protein [Rhizobium rhizogenes]NTI98405.1 hypothetical protein [Rhizobium rhizogenes]